MANSSSPSARGDSSDDDNYECIDGITHRTVNQSSGEASFEPLQTLESPVESNLGPEVVDKDAKIDELTEQVKKYSAFVDLLEQKMAKQNDNNRGFFYALVLHAIFVTCMIWLTTDSMFMRCAIVIWAIGFIAYWWRHLMGIEETQAWIKTNCLDAATECQEAAADPLHKEINPIVEPDLPSSASESPEITHDEEPAPLRTVTLQMGFDETKFGLKFIGTFVRNVARGSPAERAGVQRGDEIVSVNGVKFTGKGLKTRSARLYKNASVAGCVTLVLKSNLGGFEEAEKINKVGRDFLIFSFFFIISFPFLFLALAVKFDSAGTAFGTALATAFFGSYLILSILLNL